MFGVPISGDILGPRQMPKGGQMDRQTSEKIV
jgi:hypothetical protein